MLRDILQEEETEEDGWQYDGKAVKVKKGKYGLYVCWGDKNLALKGFGNRPPENLRQDDVFPILEKHKNGEYSSIVREISSDVSIRTGKTGSLYVFFKTSGMKKPKFIKMPKGITKSNLDEFTNDELIEKISANIDLTPRGIRDHLNLHKPIYKKSAAYGHFGRDAENDGSFSWEKIDLSKKL